jgi:hypothetical protein
VTFYSCPVIWSDRAGILRVWRERKKVKIVDRISI